MIETSDIIVYNIGTTAFRCFITEFKQVWISDIFIRNSIYNLIIPATINNYPVVTLGDSCLQNNNEEMLNNIKCITLNDKSIHDFICWKDVFKYCPNLKFIFSNNIILKRENDKFIII